MVLKKPYKFLINSLFSKTYNFYVILINSLSEILFLKFCIFSLYFPYIFLIFSLYNFFIGNSNRRNNNNNSRNNGNRNKECYNCRRRGHISKDCKAPSERNNSRNRQIPTNNGHLNSNMHL